MAAGDAEMVRARKACRGYAVGLGQLGQARDGEVEGRIGEAVLHVDHERAGPLVMRLRRGVPVDLARFGLGP